MTAGEKGRYAGRGGEKLKYAIDRLGISVRDCAAADFGCSIGGFTDCLLKEGARSVYAVDTGYGMLEWRLRTDSRVIVMERTNAMHVQLPEKVDIVTIDVGWTPQRHILPAALNAVKCSGCILSLFKPQYEADPSLVRSGIVSPENFETVLEEVLQELKATGTDIARTVRLPRLQRGKNPEAMLYIRGAACG